MDIPKLRLLIDWPIDFQFQKFHNFSISFKNSQIPLSDSPWLIKIGSKNTCSKIDINVTCTYTNIGGCALSGIGDYISFPIWANFILKRRGAPGEATPTKMGYAIVTFPFFIFFF